MPGAIQLKDRYFLYIFEVTVEECLFIVNSSLLAIPGMKRRYFSSVIFKLKRRICLNHSSFIFISNK